MPDSNASMPNFIKVDSPDSSLSITNAKPSLAQNPKTTGSHDAANFKESMKKKAPLGQKKKASLESKEDGSRKGLRRGLEPSEESEQTLVDSTETLFEDLEKVVVPAMIPKEASVEEEKTPQETSVKKQVKWQAPEQESSKTLKKEALSELSPQKKLPEKVESRFQKGQTTNLQSKEKVDLTKTSDDFAKDPKKTLRADTGQKLQKTAPEEQKEAPTRLVQEKPSTKGKTIRSKTSVVLEQKPLKDEKPSLEGASKVLRKSQDKDPENPLSLAQGRENKKQVFEKGTPQTLKKQSDGAQKTPLGQRTFHTNVEASEKSTEKTPAFEGQTKEQKLEIQKPSKTQTQPQVRLQSSPQANLQAKEQNLQKEPEKIVKVEGREVFEKSPVQKAGKEENKPPSNTGQVKLEEKPFVEKQLPRKSEPRESFEAKEKVSERPEKIVVKTSEKSIQRPAAQNTEGQRKPLVREGEKFVAKEQKLETDKPLTSLDTKTTRKEASDPKTLKVSENRDSVKEQPSRKSDLRPEQRTSKEPKKTLPQERKEQISQASQTRPGNQEGLRETDKVQKGLTNAEREDQRPKEPLQAPKTKQEPLKRQEAHFERPRSERKVPQDFGKKEALRPLRDKTDTALPKERKESPQLHREKMPEAKQSLHTQKELPEQKMTRNDLRQAPEKAPRESRDNRLESRQESKAQREPKMQREREPKIERAKFKAPEERKSLPQREKLPSLNDNKQRQPLKQKAFEEPKKGPVKQELRKEPVREKEKTHERKEPNKDVQKARQVVDQDLELDPEEELVVKAPEQVQNVSEVVQSEDIALTPQSALVSQTTRAANPQELQEIFETLVQNIQVMSEKGQSNTSVTIKNIRNFENATLTIHEFDHARGELNITFGNLSNAAKEILDRQQNQEMLKQNLSEKGYTLHIMTASTEAEVSNFESEAESDFSEPEDGQEEQEQEEQRQE